MSFLRQVVVLVALLSPLVAAGDLWGELIASDRSDRYHRPSCRVVSRIDPGHRIRFATTGDAWKRGYRPCEICRPAGFDRPVTKRPPKGAR